MRPDLIPFTAHNLELPDGTCTIPGEMLMRDRPFPRAVLRTLELLLPPGPDEAPSTVVDLGCLEGGFASLFAQAGYDALGIEGRPANVERCQALAGELGLPRLRFACDDVHHLEAYGSFDATFCSGLLYHLDDPVSFLHLVGRCTRRLLVLHTHFATEMIPPRFPNLSELAVNEGVVGRWYPEHPPEATDEEMLGARWASLGNRRSFWIERRHLVQTLIDVGFSPVFEQFDFLADVVGDDYVEEYGATLFVAVRS